MKDGIHLVECPASVPRKATATQGWTLASASFLAAVATAVLAPVLPRIASHFSSTPHVAILMSLLPTLPALFVALCAWPAGLVADRIGVRRVLLIGVGIYGFLGCAPMLLNSLPAIILTRAGVGITEAMIMTCSTALVADYFHGSERERWLAVMTGGGGIVAVTMIALGGLLGESGWRLPFAMYGIAFVLFPLCLLKTWEPVRHRQAEAAIDSASRRQAPVAIAQKYNWSPLIGISLLTVFASTSFYLVIIHLSYILAERGVTSTRTIGLGSAVAVFAGMVGAVLFKVLRLPISGKLLISFSFLAGGFLMLAMVRGFLWTEIAASINQLGAGMVLPTLLTWALSKLTVDVRARGTGIWQTAMFLGQFLSPLTVLLLRNIFGSISGALLTYGAACAVAAVLAAISCFLPDSRELVEAS
jgi:MFS family permease